MKHLIARAALAAALIAQPLAAFADECIIYQDRDYGGAWWSFEHDQHMVMVSGEDRACTSSDGGPCTYYKWYDASWNDHVSSFRTTGSCTIEMYEDINKSGASWITDKSYKYVGDDWNDVVSEVSCYC